MEPPFTRLINDWEMEVERFLSHIGKVIVGDVFRQAKMEGD